MTVTPFKSEPNEDVIKILKAALRQAESGEIQSLILVGTTHDASVFSDFSHKVRWEPVMWLGEFDLLKRDIMDLCSRRIPLVEQI